MMIELNERYSNVTFRLLVVRCAKGDVPTRDTLFNGVSGNMILDNLNTERYSILRQKFFKMKAPNMGTNGLGLAPLPAGAAGLYDAVTIA